MRRGRIKRRNQRNRSVANGSSGIERARVSGSSVSGLSGIERRRRWCFVRPNCIGENRLKLESRSLRDGRCCRGPPGARMPFLRCDLFRRRKLPNANFELAPPEWRKTGVAFSSFALTRTQIPLAPNADCLNAHGNRIEGTMPGSIGNRQSTDCASGRLGGSFETLAQFCFWWE
jgi:hypothetical protein